MTIELHRPTATTDVPLASLPRLGGNISIANPINIAPGYVVTSVKAFASINGSPFFSLTDNSATLQDEGYYEIDVADSADAATRYPVCIVDTTKLTAAIESPSASLPVAFRRLSALLAPAFPHGKVAPHVQDRSHTSYISTNRAVYLEIRGRSQGSSYTTIASALARTAGTWPSGTFNLPRGAVDLRLAVTVAPDDTVLE